MLSNVVIIPSKIQRNNRVNMISAKDKILFVHKNKFDIVRVLVDWFSSTRLSFLNQKSDI